MKSHETIKSIKELNKISFDDLKEIYFRLYSDAKDEWFPTMYVSDECPHCKGEAHPFENFKQIYMQIRCFNSSCSYYGKVTLEFFKLEDYYRGAIALKMELSDE